MFVSKTENYVLPSGWSKSYLPDFTNIVMGQSPTSDTYNKSGKGMPFYQGKTEFGVLYPTVVKYCTAPNKIALPGATLLSVRAPVGPTNLAKEICCIGRGLSAIHPADKISPMFILYLLRSIETDLSKEGTGSTFSAINKQFIEELEFGLPPLSEQHRIVAKIEELFSELDKGVESLKTAHAQLKVYRQALLKHAFEGKLTAEWREQNKDKLETASALQQRIQTERAARFQQQLIDWQAAGKKGSKPKAPKPLPPLTEEELVELPTLSDGWFWLKYGEICSIIKNGISEKPIGDSGAPIFRISAVRALSFDMSDIRYIDNSSGKFNNYCLEYGDLVFTRYNGSRHYVGVCAEYKSKKRHLFPDKLVQTRIFKRLFSTSYFEKALNSAASRKFLESKIRTTAGQSGISGDDIKSTPVPICSTLEQSEIVVLLEEKLSVVDQLEQAITAALQQSEALRQSILKKAFSGALVPQDTNDEPASVLLARIKAEQFSNKIRAKF